MSQAEAIPEYFLARGLSLSDDVGVDEYAFDRPTSLELLDALGERQAILGGDVYSQTTSGIEAAYANWSCERKESETPGEFARRSRTEAQAYIERYREPEGEKALYTLVIGEASI